MGFWAEGGSQSTLESKEQGIRDWGQGGGREQTHVRSPPVSVLPARSPLMASVPDPATGQSVPLDVTFEMENRKRYTMTTSKS